MAGKFGAWFTGHKTETLLGAGGIVVTIALYVRSKNASAAVGGSTTSTVEPDSTADTTDSDLYNELEGQINQLQQSVTTGLAATAGGTPINGWQSEPLQLAPGSPPLSSAQQTLASLPWVGPGSLPDNITTAMVGEYGPFEQVGYDTNGVYSGDQVAGGVPLFGQFGSGYFQNFGEKGGPSPNYTGPVFAPESDKEYVGYTGPISGAP